MSNKKNNINGWIFVDKPKNFTSQDVLNVLKKIFSPTKIGHGGTLDPLAQGILPVCFGEATKTLDYVLNANKTYEFSISFGIETTTDDLEGEIINKNDFMPSQEILINSLRLFRGNIEQVPSKFSAIKINGKKSYDLARKGIEFDMPKRFVNIISLELLDYNFLQKTATFKANVSKGTYIRTLAKDIAKSVGAFGVVSYLKRTKIDINKEIILISLNNLYNMEYYLSNKKIFWSIEDMLDDISAYQLTKLQALHLLNGNVGSLDFPNITSGVLKAMYQDKIIALLNYQDSEFKILRVFNMYKELINNKECSDVN